MTSDITIKLLGLMRKPGDRAEHTTSHTTGLTVGAALVAIGYRPDEVGFFSVQIDEQLVRADRLLVGGEQLTVFLPLGGG